EAGDRVGQAQLAVREPERVAAQHVELAVSEVDQADHAEHEREARRHHRVERAQREPMDRLLEQILHALLGRAAQGWIGTRSRIFSWPPRISTSSMLMKAWWVSSKRMRPTGVSVTSTLSSASRIDFRSARPVFLIACSRAGATA